MRKIPFNQIKLLQIKLLSVVKVICVALGAVIFLVCGKKDLAR